MGLALRLLGGFELRDDGHLVDPPAAGRRLLAYLALQGRPLPRSFVAGTLWPETTDAKAAANMRTTLWRLHGFPADLVVAGATSIQLGPAVAVDTRDLQRLAAALAAGDAGPDPSAIEPATLAGELLPELWDSWVVFERERLRQVSLHALELLSRRLSAMGRHAAAVLAALAAVEVEPLRETSNRVLVEAHLAEGNLVEAVRQYRRYADLLRRELHAAPHPSFRALVEIDAREEAVTRS